MNVGSLFSGIGGLDLGLARAGFRHAFFCESDAWRRSVLAQHWPGVPIYEDVRDVDAGAPACDLLAGGFPCQPVSVAGKRLAQADGRWLWPVRSQPSFASYDPASSSWKTSQGSLLEEGGWETYSATWPDSGTCLSGTAYRRRPLAPRTFGIESGLLPTPTRASYGMNQQDSPGAAVRPSLETMARRGRFPTPIARDWKGTGRERQLGTMASTRGAWPTPKASPAGPDFARVNRPRSGGDDLATSVARGESGPLNPTWVEWLMGFPLGWTDLADSETP